MTEAPDEFRKILKEEWPNTDFANLPEQQKQALASFIKRKSMKGLKVYAFGSAGPREEDLDDLRAIQAGCLRVLYLAMGQHVCSHPELPVVVACQLGCTLLCVATTQLGCCVATTLSHAAH